VRQAKTRRQHVKKPKHYTPPERMALRRSKRRNGPSGLRRAARRKPLQDAHAAALLATPEPSTIIPVALDTFPSEVQPEGQP
jgi:hypothetical protein